MSKIMFMNKEYAGSWVGLIDFFYRVGTVYSTTDANFDPNVEWGGTWVKLDEGQVLLSAGENYEAGQQHGSNTHTLTVDEMPSHTHIQNAHTHGIAQHSGSGEIYSGWHYELVVNNQSGPVYNTNATNNRSSSATQYSTPTNNNTGGGQPHSIMQLSTAVYMWHRIA